MRTSVLNTGYSRLGQAIYQLFEMKRLFLFIGNLAACIEENVSTQAEEQPLCKPYSRRSELIVPDKSFLTFRQGFSRDKATQ